MTRVDAVADEEASDFLDFAAARQWPALRAATLVTADPRLGRDVATRALSDLAGRWSQAREDGPERALRTVLYRAAVLAAPSDSGRRAPDARLHPPAVRRTTVDGDESSTPDPDDDDDADDVERRRRSVRQALGQLTPRARAVAALRWLEDRPDLETADLLDVPLATVVADVDAVRRGLAGIQDPRDPRPVDDEDARELLAELADEVPEVELAGSAWTSARDRRRAVRRRAVVGVGLGGAGVLAATVLLGGEADPAPPGPSPGPVASDGALDVVTLGGARVVLAPEPVQEQDLPLYPDALSMGLPRSVGPGGEDTLTILSPAGTDAPVRAVYLVRVDEDRYQPVVLMPRQSSQPVLVPMAPLRPTVDAGGNTSLGLGPATVDPGRHRLVFPQPGELVLLELRSSRTQRFTVPDENLQEAGWTTGGHVVVVRSERAAWLVDTRTGDVIRAGGPVNAGWAGIRTTTGAAFVETFSDDGRLTRVRSMTGPDLDVYGPSVSTPDRWACRGAFFASVPEVSGRLQGLVAVQGRERPEPTILAASTADGVSLAAYRPLTWGPRTTVLLESRTGSPGGGGRVLAWDVAGDRLTRVADVQPIATGTDRAFTGAWTF